MRYVARATNHPKEDLERNWSAVIGGLSNPDFHICSSIEEAREMWNKYYRIDEYRVSKETNRFKEEEWGYHPAYGGFVQVHYMGLGGYLLEAGDLEEAISEATERFGNDVFGMACVLDRGTGHFYSDACRAYYPAGPEGLWIFEVYDII